MPLKPIAILGAGAWGTALALYLARREQPVRLWSIDPTEIAALQTDKENKQFLPGFPFPDTLYPITDLAEAIKGVNDILVVVPSVGLRSTLTLLKPLLTSDTRIICASKGLDTATGDLISTIVENVLGKERKFAVLSGPSFAREVAAGLPTAVAIASQDQHFLADLKKRFNSDIFSVHPTDDVIGTEVGGVVKNVIAIATGISDGMEFGANGRCAILTYGLAEMIRLGTTIGGKLESLIGLAGMGDLILTATDNQSRNRRLGLALGQGHDIKAAEKAIGQVVEGKRNAELVTILAAKHQVNMPVCTTVWDILQGKLDAKDAIKKIIVGG